MRIQPYRHASLGTRVAMRERMLPLSLVAFTLRDGAAHPHYLAPRDEPWIRLLVDSLDALVGRTQGDAARILAAKLQEISVQHDVPLAAIRGVRHLLERAWRSRPAAPIASRQIRRVVFELGRDATTRRDEVLRRAAQLLRITPEQVAEGLFADTSSERRLTAPIAEPSPRELIDGYNLMLVQEFLLRSEQLVLHVGAHAARVLRALKQKDLMYSFHLDTHGATITVPGPVSLYRHTVRYGRALVGFFPAVAAVPDWALDARCVLGGKLARFHADASDPIVAVPSNEGANFVERHLFTDFRRLGSRWSAFPAAQVVRANGAMFLPDVVFERGLDRILVELIGFHTAPYLAAKVEALRTAGLSSVLLCVDDSLACSEETAAEGDDVLHFHKRIPVGRLLRAIDRLAANRDAPPDSDQPSS
jgi:predicted nuclease of restriction endonuclease-like RecB superfamily